MLNSVENDLAKARLALKNAELLYSPEEVEIAIDKMAEEITKQLKNKSPICFCIMNGGLIISGRLLSKLSFPLEISYIHATRYGNAIKGKDIKWEVAPTGNLKNRTILLIDDILDEGITLQTIKEYCEETGAKEVFTAVLIDKQHNRKVLPKIKADFTGLEAPDRFLFGCGMDYMGYWRNLPAIYAL
ncbi:MAG: hypoxanthine-guanine phosphoribosyltransferase [Desulfuromonadales bacterium]|nr:hypoxanthine-guanine phosphoribosyltransferase [Desulfuromonadales bacterium]